MKAPTPDDLTGPERHAERAQGKDARDTVNRCGGCFCCLSRNKATEHLGFGLAECGLTPPQRFKKPGCTFTPDYTRIYPGRFED